MHTRHICLLGFSKQAESVIKSQLSEQCCDFDLVWVAANAKNMDGVVINAMFIDTPQIKKYLSAISAPCVAIYTQLTAKSIALKHGIPVMEFRESMTFEKSWLNTLLQATDVEAGKNVDTVVSHVDQGNNQKNYQELIEIIKNRSAVCIVAHCGDKRTYLSPSESNAFINFARSDIPGVENWQWQTIDTIPHENEAMRRINIDQWLFETIWQSQAEAFSVDSSMFYKLIRWPQPFSQSKRSEALRLAAQIKFHPVKIADLAEKTRFPYGLIEQFLFATVQAGQVEIITPSQESLISDKKVKVAKKDPDREIKRGFIGKLRAKLGL